MPRPAIHGGFWPAITWRESRPLLLTTAAPALALYARAIRHGGREPELEDLPAVAS